VHGVADRLRPGGAVEEQVGDPALLMRKPTRPPYRTSLVPIVGTMVPSPVTVATMRNGAKIAPSRH